MPHPVLAYAAIKQALLKEGFKPHEIHLEYAIDGQGQVVTMRQDAKYVIDGVGINKQRRVAAEYGLCSKRKLDELRLIFDKVIWIAELPDSKSETTKTKIISKEEALQWIDQFEETKQWLGRFKVGTTKVRYAKYLMTYVAHTGLNPKQLIELKQNQKNHDAEKLLDRFVAEADIPQSTLRNISTAVKSFYKWNYEDLARACGRVSRAKLKPYRTPTQKDLKTFIIGTNPRDKALILFMSATRIREETVTLLDWRHVWKDLFEEPRDPPHIGLMAKELKGKGGRNYNDLEQHTFLTPDAKEALLAYKKWREDRTGEKVTPESPLFTSVYSRSKKKERIGTDLIRKTFERASERTGLKFSAHDVGRFTQTQLENARIQPNWVKKITGHKVKGEENPYSRPKIEKLREAYGKAITFLTTEVKEVTRDPLLADVENLAQIQAVREYFQSIVEDAKVKLAEMLKLQKAPAKASR